MSKLKLHELPLHQSKRVYDARGEELPERSARGPLPRISIVTPSFNQGDFLEECIVSVLEQGYPDLEYIIMDGGSTDQSVEIIKKYEKYLTYWQSQPDGGQYRAIEAGFKRCTGEVLAWLNSDDKYHPGCLMRVGETMTAYPQVSWLTGRPSVWNADGDLVDVRLLRNFTREDYLDPDQDTHIQQESTFWRRSIWEMSGARLSPEFDFAGDFELWMRFFDHGELHVIDALLGGFRYHAAQKTAVAGKRYRDESQQIRSNYQVGEPTPRDTPRRVVEIATSLVPHNVSGQLPAVRSWQKLGFSVVSINPAEEIEHLAGRYPGVRFVTAKRDGRQIVGKPCVFIDDILAHFESSKADSFGIINSDIHLVADSGFMDFVSDQSKGALVYGSRVEVKGAGSALGYTYHYGFDYFFFDRELIKRYPASDFMLGIPWWDYWVPFRAAQSGLKTKRLDSYLAFHVSHPVNYRPDDLYRFKDHLLDVANSGLLHDAIERTHFDVKAPDADVLRETQLAVLGDVIRCSLEAHAQKLDYTGCQVKLNSITLGKESTRRYRVSAIVSTYASEAHIRECLDDLLSQSIAEETEIIVIDAASPEGEGAIVSAYQTRHNNIRYVRTPERIGVYAAWNMAIRMAQGDYLVSCSTNDRLRPNALELMARVLDEQPEMALTYGFSYLTRTPHESFSNFTYAGCYKWNDYSYPSLLSQPSVGPHPMWRRRLHDELGWFNENYSAISDQDFWLRVGSRYPMRALWDFTGLYFVSDDSLSGNKPRAQSEYRQIVEPYRRQYAYELWREGRFFTKYMGAYCDRMIAEWQTTPVFTILIRHKANDFSSLSTSIQSIAAQYYGEARLVILSALEAPTSAKGANLIWLICDPTAWAATVNTYIEEQCKDNKPHWFIVLEDGDTLDPRALLMLAQHIKFHPEHRIIYFDEEEAGSGNRTGTPHFKPSFDTVLLQATPYLGEVVATLIPHFTAMQGFRPEYQGAEHHELVLRTIETASTDAIGHIADILLQRPHGRYAPLPLIGHAQALADHLSRLNIDASIEFTAGQALLTRFASSDEKTNRTTLGIIIYPSVCSVSALECSISSLFERTSNTTFSLYVLDPGGKAPELSAFIQGLGNLQLPNLHRLTMPSGNLLAGLQAAVELVRESHLVFWADDCLAIQDNWPDHMLQQFLRPESPVAIGPRLANSAGQLVSAGEESGLCGVAASPYAGVFLDYPGDSFSLLAEHGVEILDKRCFIASADAVRRAGGIKADTGEALWAADLCMRLREIGPILWTPATTMLVSTHFEDLEQTDRIAREKARYALDETQLRFYRRWGKRMGRHAGRNPNLHIDARDHIPETRSALTFDPFPHAQLPRLYAHVADREGSGNYRILQPMQALLTKARVRGGVATDTLSPAQIAADEFDAFIFQRAYSAKMLEAINTHRQLGKAKRIYEIDDLITQIPTESPHAKNFGPEEIKLFKAAVRSCNRLVVSTPALAQAYGSLADEVRIAPNFLPGHLWNKVEVTQRQHDKPRVGWAGSISHQGDLKLLNEVIRTIGNEVEWVFMGTCRREMREHLHEILPAVGFSDYPQALAQMRLDVALAPLSSNPFNEAKSPLKILEYGILAYPVICSDVGPYRQRFPITRVANTPKTWISAIRAHIHDLDASRREGEALQAHIRKHWMLEDHLDEWLAAWT